MNGVKRGLTVRFRYTLQPGPGASNFQRRTAPEVEATGTVLDRAPSPGSWWVLPHGERRAVEVRSAAMEPARVMH